MKLKIKNIGLIKDCEIDINGITVIAGSNNTGKSTIGKTLRILFNSSYKIENKIKDERVIALTRLLIRRIKNIDDEEDYFELESILEEISKNNEEYLKDINKLEKKLNKFISKEEFKIKNEILNRTRDILKLKKEELIDIIFKSNLIEDFDGNITNISNDGDGNISLQIKDNIIEVKIKNKDDIHTIYPSGLSLQTEVLYIDDPFALDAIGKRRIQYFAFNSRSYHLISKLKSDRDVNFVEQLLANKKLEKVEKILNEICDGDIVEEEGRFIYKQHIGSLGMSNLSAGLKSFVILKTLLLNGSISYNGTIILDEPEIHLHPEWQIVYAELIVLLQKEFNLHILINTHSPYFINALYIFSKKFNISEKNKYYLTEREGYQSSVSDVTDNEDMLYKKLAKAFLDLENLRDELDD